MKTFYRIILTLMIVVCLVSPVMATTGKIDLGYNGNSASGAENVYLAVEAEATEDKITVKMDTKINQQQVGTNEATEIKVDFQANYKIKQWSYFANTRFLDDMASGISDQFDIGLGAGYQLDKNFRIQTGFYRRSGPKEEFLNRSSFEDNCKLGKSPFLCVVKGELELNLNNFGDYITMVEPKIIFTLSKRASFDVAYELQYLGHPENGYPKTIRKPRITLGVKF